MNYRNLLGGLALVLSMSAFAQTSVNVNLGAASVAPL